MTSPVTANLNLEPDRNAARASRRYGQLPDDMPLTTAELVKRRIRVIALADLFIALPVEAPDRQLTLARGLAANMRSLPNTAAF